MFSEENFERAMSVLKDKPETSNKDQRSKGKLILHYFVELVHSIPCSFMIGRIKFQRNRVASRLSAWLKGGASIQS